MSMQQDQRIEQAEFINYNMYSTSGCKKHKQGVSRKPRLLNRVNPMLKIADEPPWSHNLTDYDKTHFSLYMQLLSAAAENASEAEMAEGIFGINPIDEFERAQRAVRSHLVRVNWILSTGYAELFSNDRA